MQVYTCLRFVGRRDLPSIDWDVEEDDDFWIIDYIDRSVNTYRKAAPKKRSNADVSRSCIAGELRAKIMHARFLRHLAVSLRQPWKLELLR